MPMETIFDVTLEGPLEQPSLDRLRKLLNLTPHGRLTDTEDWEFGKRALRDVEDEWVCLTLWRYPDAGWSIRLTFTGPHPPDPVVDACLAEVVGATRALGLRVTKIWHSSQRLLAYPAALELPTHRALSMRLVGEQRPWGRLTVDDRDTLQRMLHLRCEGVGYDGTEFGWRYVRWDPPENSLLLQLFDDPATGTEVALLFSRLPPPADVVSGCRLQVTAAAAELGVRLSQTPPEQSAVAAADLAAALARHAANAATLQELLATIGSSPESEYEMVRGKLLWITRQPEWQAADEELQLQVHHLLLDLHRP